MEKWLVQTKKADFNKLGMQFGINPVIARIIRNRDIISPEEFKEYLECRMDQNPSPMRMKDMEQAVKIIERGIRGKKRMRVIGDYDIDGVTSGYILTDVIRKLGGDVDFDVPDRVTDGYGINDRLIRKAYEEGIRLIVTCDNGIAASAQTRFAKELGMEMVITDHHEVPFAEEEGEKKFLLPEADAVVDHKRPDCEYPFKELCGAGIAYKLADALFERFFPEGMTGEGENKTTFLKEYLCFAAIGTVGDLVPLIKENRTMVKNGLRQLPEIHNLGIRALIEVNELDINRINSTHIGFVIGPCINAGGRLDTAKKAFQLFQSKTPEEARNRAVELKALNDERKDMTVRNTERAIELIEHEEGFGQDRILVVYLPGCHESLAGIIAGRLKEQYYKPTIVLTDSSDGILKGSGRSVEGYSMFEQLTRANLEEKNAAGKPLMLKFGGHKMAAGLSIRKEDYQRFRKKLNSCEDLTDDMLVKKVWIDVAMPFEYITEDLIRQLSLLEPFGMSNEKPVFAEKCTVVEKLRIFGKNRNVVSLTVRNRSGFKMDAVLFTDGDRFVQEIRDYYGDEETDRVLMGKNNRIGMNILYYPQIDEYNGRTNIKVVIKGYLWYNQ